ncbi:pilus assembly protein CpaB [Bacillus oleivorans]|uniref:Pilus assembly protein CpaB n=1 Tax=Bacillus oleivorans TaxID=1448271 RepID=A0A285CIQ1_9BACI|nr:Flp pilus assembly protein CpaB [Bacillus oleivorans]SNX66863.1 pilus assembly protein CpaB [Bacillus oleivorans]
MRSKIILVLALVMGVVTTVMFFNYMKQFDTETVANQNMTTVVAAKEKIAKNELITAEKLTTIEVPSEGLHEQAIVSMDGLAGQYATADIEAGEVLLDHRVQDEKEETIFVSKKVGEGNRGVSIGVNFVQSVSNLVEPEDKVDVIFTEVIEMPGEQQDIVESSILLREVRVLAVDRRMIETQNEAEPHAEYSSVTLELSPEDTVKLVNAYESGSLHLAVHSRIVADVVNDTDE